VEHEAWTSRIGEISFFVAGSAKFRSVFYLTGGAVFALYETAFLCLTIVYYADERKIITS